MQDDVTLESVPGFDRPMSANPNDRVVGEETGICNIKTMIKKITKQT